MFLLLGILLLGATGAFAGLLIAYNSAGGPDYTVVMFGNTLGTLTSLQVFLAGIALTLVFCLGLLMVFGGASGLRRRRAARLAEHREAQAVLARRDALAAGDVPQAEMKPDERAPEVSVSAPRRHHRPHVFGH
jgi:hypothetical protein